jgi:hypothetical protein
VRHVPPERHHATIGRIVEALRAPKPYDLLANRTVRSFEASSHCWPSLDS